jgi:hypothetical protein
MLFLSSAPYPHIHHGLITSTSRGKCDCLRNPFTRSLPIYHHLYKILHITSLQFVVFCQMLIIHSVMTYCPCSLQTSIQEIIGQWYCCFVSVKEYTEIQCQGFYYTQS